MVENTTPALTQVEQEIWALHESGKSLSEICAALKLKCSKETLRKRIIAIGKKRPVAEEPRVVAPMDIPFRPKSHIVREIIKEEAARAGLKVDDILGPSRAPPIVAARSYAMWRARKEIGWSFPEIGRVFHRDHTTVMYAVNKIEREKAGE